MSATRGRGHRQRRRGEQGFTLIETLVSLSILAVIGTVVGTAFSVGLKVVGRGGAGDRFSVVGDQSLLEETLGRDVARASCIEVSGTTTYGLCTNGFTEPPCNSALLCVGWVQFPSPSIGGPPTCQVAVFTLSTSPQTNGQLARTEYSATTTATPISTTFVTSRSEPVTLAFTPAPQTFMVPRVGAAPYPWLRSLSITVTSKTVSTTPAVYTLRPLSSDPSGAAATIVTAGPPC